MATLKNGVLRPIKFPAGVWHIPCGFLFALNSCYSGKCNIFELSLLFRYGKIFEYQKGAKPGRIDF